MKRLFLGSWPLVAVVMLTLTLVLQIPRKALFFKPVPVFSPKAFASFVSYDAKAYETVVVKARMAWQVRGARGRTIESHVDAFDFVDDMPPLQSLGLPDEFVRTRTQFVLPVALVPLLPPSLADQSGLVPVAATPADDGEVRRIRAELLELPESLQSNE